MLELQLERMAEMVNSRFFGKYRGVVTDNRDPAAQGRLEVRIPAVLGDQPVWALPCVPVANGDGSGFFAMPDVDASVWVEFEAGNLNYPIWTGCFWPAGAIDSADAAPAIKFWKTARFTVRIDDDAGELVIEKTGGGGKLTITATEISAEANSVKQTAGGQTAVLSQTSFDVNNGAFTVM